MTRGADHESEPDAAAESDTVWFNCSVGVAGDMLLGALVDAGADPERIAADVAALGVTGYTLTFRPVHRASLAATRAHVVVDGPDAGEGEGVDPHPHRPVGEILDQLRRAELPERVRQRATEVFEELGRAEGVVHGIDPADVELHEVGSVDAIVDVVGVCSALESLDAGHISASAVGLGHGTVGTAHGVLPHPAPAVARMLADHGVPVVGLDTPLELATPTGIACLVVLCNSFGAPPAMTVARSGFGAGASDLADRPNVVGVLAGTAAVGPDDAQATGGTDESGGTAVLIDTNVDDVSGEVLAHTISVLLTAGALDAWATPIVMKKGRPAHTLSVLASPTDEARLRHLLVAETGTLGTRATTVRRHPEHRELQIVSLDGVELRLKRSGERVKVEYDDAVAASDRLGIPLREVLRRAEHLAGDG